MTNFRNFKFLAQCMSAQDAQFPMPVEMIWCSPLILPLDCRLPLRAATYSAVSCCRKRVALGVFQYEVFFAMIRCFHMLLNQEARKIPNPKRCKALVDKSTKSIAALNQLCWDKTKTFPFASERSAISSSFCDQVMRKNWNEWRRGEMIRANIFRS